MSLSSSIWLVLRSTVCVGVCGCGWVCVSRRWGLGLPVAPDPPTPLVREQRSILEHRIHKIPTEEGDGGRTLSGGIPTPSAVGRDCHRHMVLSLLSLQPSHPSQFRPGDWELKGGRRGGLQQGGQHPKSAKIAPFSIILPLLEPQKKNDVSDHF